MLITIFSQTALKKSALFGYAFPIWKFIFNPITDDKPLTLHILRIYGREIIRAIEDRIDRMHFRFYHVNSIIICARYLHVLIYCISGIKLNKNQGFWSMSECIRHPIRCSQMNRVPGANESHFFQLPQQHRTIETKLWVLSGLD